MASFDVSRDEQSGVVRCRIAAVLSDAEADALAAQLRRSAADAHTRGKLRLLFENTSGKTFSTYATDALDRSLKASLAPGDRTAVLVSDSLNKLYAKRNMRADASVFVSEPAAITWLTAWD